MKKIIVLLCALAIAFAAGAQSKKFYDETIDPLQQIDQAVKRAKADDKYVICQVGGNWCRWCIMFGNYIEKDAEIASVISENFEYIHVNWPRKDAPEALKNRLDNAGRFGFPVFVVMDGDGEIIHIQDSSYLEEGEGYNKQKVLRFLNNWTPGSVGK